MIRQLAEGLSVYIPDVEVGPSFEKFSDFVNFMRSRPTEEIKGCMAVKYQDREALAHYPSVEAPAAINFINRQLDAMRRELLKRGHRVRQVRYGNGDTEMKDELLPHAFCHA